MRVNVYAEEITSHIELVAKGRLEGICFYLHLPVTTANGEIRGPYMHRPGDDDSSAVTFWGKREDLRQLLRQALAKLDSSD